MHESIELKKREIEELCRAHPVRRLDLFGSAVGDGFDVRSSDVDVLVEFGAGPGFDYFGTYFDLKEGLARAYLWDASRAPCCARWSSVSSKSSARR
ncbi:nucleotidyltransferase family protein [Amycolatopsis japonica]